MNFIDTMETGGVSVTYSEAPIADHQSIINHQPADLLFAVPASETDDFNRLPDAVRRALTTTLLIVQAIHRAPNKSAEIDRQSRLRAGLRGFSRESLARKYYCYANGGKLGGVKPRFFDPGDWRCLVDSAKAGPAFWNTDSQVGLPAAFVEFWKSLCERNQRKTAPARRVLIQQIWKTGYGPCPVTGKPIHYKQIPGYDTWPEAEVGGDYPKGWSVANLNRHAPTRFELAVSRIGREAAAQHRRKVFTTRFGLAVGRFYLFDDLEYDKKVNWPGAREATKPLGLVGLDLYSACAIALGFKPTLIDSEGAKKKLREKDMLWLVAHVLCNKGYRSDEFGTTLVVEHGTAAIRTDFEERIATATGHKVTVDRSGISNEHMSGLFEGASKGNPRFKAALESLFNLVHNEGAGLPGNTGKDRQHAPTESVGLERYNSQLLKLAQSLPPERAALLQFPVLSFSHFVELTLDIYHRINHRTDHRLEGWEKCGHIQQDFTLNLPGLPPAPLSQEQWFALSPVQRAALEPNISADCRRLSPQEVWNRGAKDLHRLGNEMLPVLLGPDFGEERAVGKNGYITVEDKELCHGADDPLRYPAPAYDVGEKFLTYLNPHNVHQLILTDAQGRYKDTLPLQEPPTRGDHAALRAQLGAARKEEAQRLAPVLGRLAPVVEARRDMHRRNLAVVNGQPVTPAEIESAQKLRAMVRKDGREALNDLLDGAAQAEAAEARAASMPNTDDATIADALSSPSPRRDPDDAASNQLIDDVL
jgi:hypothetical protein